MKKTKVLISVAALVGFLMFFPGSKLEARKSGKKGDVHKTVVVKRDVDRNYNHHPQWGHKVRSVPKSSVIIRHRGVNFRFHAGVYYRPSGSTFVISAPPLGLRIRTLPASHRKIFVKGRPYFYYYGVYYIYNQPARNYEVVRPPVGAWVDSLPDGYSRMVIDGYIYYVYDNIYYKAVLDRNGDVFYEVVSS